MGPMKGLNIINITVLAYFYPTKTILESEFIRTFSWKYSGKKNIGHPQRLWDYYACFGRICCSFSCYSFFSSYKQAQRLNIEGTLSWFLDFFLQPIIKDRPNYFILRKHNGTHYFAIDCLPCACNALKNGPYILYCE